jgi:hypothetical protein
MSEGRKTKKIWVIALLLIAFGLLTWAIVRGGKELLPESKQPVETTSQVSGKQQKTVIPFDRLAQERGGIVVAALESMSHGEKIQAYGIVLELQNLTDLRNRYIQAKAQLENEVTRVEVSKKEYERLKTLNEDDKNVSDKALQGSEAVWRSDEVNLRASQEALPVLEGAVQQQWGDVIARWVFEGSQTFYSLIQQQEVLVQITLSPGVHLSSLPETISVQAPDGTLVSAHFVSLSPRTEPRIQGMSFFYIASGQPVRLLPGMNVVAFIPTGPEAKGFFIPGSSVVWWQGKAWVYLRTSRDHFVRRNIPTENPVKEGYFVVKGFRPGERIVVKGAQLLLSDEFLSKNETGGGEE